MKQAYLLPSLALAFLFSVPANASSQSTSNQSTTNSSQSTTMPSKGSSPSTPGSTSSEQGSMSTTQNATAPNQGAPSAGGRNDAEIQSKLSHDLSSDKFKNVRTSVQDGVVTLQGTVELDATKEQAERKASHIDHVAGVRNQIEVVGKQVPDEQLRNQLADKLRYDRLGYGYGNVFNALTLNVQNGYVTVGGSVRTEPDRSSALALIENTPGVKGVRDDIRVEPVSGFDDELRLRLARAIYGDPVLQKYAIDPQAPIRIVVDRGNVALYGVVDSEMDKNVAGIRAKEVPGTFKVENHLVVVGTAREKEKEQQQQPR